MRVVPKRKQIQLKDYDYAQEGYYFITICTKDHENLFGNVINSKIQLSELGKVVYMCWEEIPKHYPHVSLDEFIVMPNHVHGILLINERNKITQKLTVDMTNNVGAQNLVPLREVHVKNQFQKIIPRSIGAIIRGFKIGVTKWCREKTDIYQPWQRLFHDHIIRNDQALQNIREYIRNNPLKWQEDIENKEYQKKLNKEELVRKRKNYYFSS